MKQLYRGWNTVTKTMLDLHAITPLILNFDQDGIFIPFDDKVIIMPYTGMEDYHNKPIYVDDIVQIDQGEGIYLHSFLAPVIFENCKFTIDYFRAKQVENSTHWKGKGLKHNHVDSTGFQIHWNSPGYHSLYSAKGSIFITGNIHEDPELLMRTPVLE